MLEYMSDSDSDESINTEDLNEINDLTSAPFEEVEVKSCERQKQVKRIPYREPSTAELEEQDAHVTVYKNAPKPKKPRTEKQIAHSKKLSQLNKERAEVRKKARAEGKILDEKPLGRKPKPKPPKEEVVVNRQVEKIIYMIPNAECEGGFERHLNKPRITKKDIQYHKNLQEAEQEELIAGRKLLTTKKGKVDKRGKKERTPAQIKATEALVENARKRREEAKKNKQIEKRKDVEEIKDSVHNSIVEVVQTPASQLKKKERRIPERPPITDEDRKRVRDKKVKDLFS